MNQLVSALMQIHRQNNLHRDLKPENILLSSDGELKLADFGLVVRVKNSIISEILSSIIVSGYLSGFGSLRYCSTEMINDNYKPESESY